MIRKIFFTVILIFISAKLFATPIQVPLLFAYQSTLIDEGGNLLPTGYTDINFKILDSLGNVVYEETQNTYIDRGMANVMIGNGVDPTHGSPTGGIPVSALEPTDTRFLLVEVPGYKPYDKVEIVSAPYAVWADTATKMPDGAITNAMLGKSIITKDNFSEELKNELFTTLQKSQLPSDTLYAPVMQGSQGASKVGVETAFIYSSSQTVQGVLKDLDIAINKRRQEIDYQVTVLSGADTTHANSATTHSVTGNIVGTENAQTLTNKTLTSPTINGGTVNNTTGNHNGTWKNFSVVSNAEPAASGQVVATDGQGFLTTPHSAPVGDYQTVNKKYVDDSVKTIGGIHRVLLTEGSGTWTVPAGVTSLKVLCVGGGGGGGGGADNSGPNGGGGGGHFVTPLSYEFLTVSPGQVISYSIGAGGVGGGGGGWGSNGLPGQDGENTTFGNIIGLGAKGGAGGAPGTGGKGVIIGTNAEYNIKALKLFADGDDGGQMAAGGGDGAPGVIGNGVHGMNGFFWDNLDIDAVHAGKGGDGYGAGGGGGTGHIFEGDGTDGDIGGAGSNGVVIIEY